MRTVRTTMQPDKKIEVGEVEYLDLKRQGLLIEETPTPTPEPAPVASAASAKKTPAGPAGSKES